MAGVPIIRVTDLILRNIFSSDEWPVIFPFIDASPRATVVLENVIIEMDTQHGFGNSDLKRMVKGLRKRTRPDGLGSGRQQIEVWKAEDCRSRLTEFKSCQLSKHLPIYAFPLDSAALCVAEKCPKEAECPSGAIFIEDASFLIERGDGNGDLAFGVRYHVRQCLVTVIPPPAGVINGTDSKNVVEYSESHPGTAIPVTQHSSDKQTLIFSAAVIVGVMCVLMAVCVFTIYRCDSHTFSGFEHMCRFRLSERWSGPASDRSTGSVTARIAEKTGIQEARRTFLTPEIPTNPLAAYTISHSAMGHT